MNCPACESEDTVVRKTMVVGAAVARMRSCIDCTSEWTTEETVRLVHRRTRPATADQGTRPVYTGGHRRTRVVTGDQAAATSTQESGSVSGLVLTSPPVPEADPDPERAIHGAPPTEPEPCDEIEPFPVNGSPPGSTWRAPQVLITELAAAYPAVDVVAEARKARVWILASPANRKTARGMGKFLTGWVGRARPSNGTARAGPRDPSVGHVKVEAGKEYPSGVQEI